MKSRREFYQPRPGHRSQGGGLHAWRYRANRLAPGPDSWKMSLDPEPEDREEYHRGLLSCRLRAPGAGRIIVDWMPGREELCPGRVICAEAEGTCQLISIQLNWSCFSA